MRKWRIAEWMKRTYFVLCLKGTLKDDVWVLIVGLLAELLPGVFDDVEGVHRVFINKELAIDFKINQSSRKSNALNYEEIMRKN